jgi:mRNA interferase RelE/StbE
MARVDLFPEAVEDIDELDGSERKQVFKGLLKLEADPSNRGAPLGSALTTFRKLVVGNRQIRIVYRVEEDGTVAVVWVVASRVEWFWRRSSAGPAGRRAGQRRS